MWIDAENVRAGNQRLDLSPAGRSVCLLYARLGDALSVVALQLPFSVETTAHEKDLATVRQRLAQALSFFCKEGGEAESPAFNPYAGELARLVAATGGFRDSPLRQAIARRRDRAHLPECGAGMDNVEIPEEFAVDFGGMLALTGMSAEPAAPDGFGVKFRWRCTKSPRPRITWRFTI